MLINHMGYIDCSSYGWLSKLWSSIIIRPLIFRVKRDHNFDNQPYQWIDE